MITLIHNMMADNGMHSHFVFRSSNTSGYVHVCSSDSHSYDVVSVIS